MSGVALFCSLFPESSEKQERCISLLRKNAREYYRHPKAKCTAWTYFTPLPSPKQVSQPTPPLIAGLEVYTEKSALQAQLDDPIHFQRYHEIVKQEALYAKPEELVAWYQAAGFIARDAESRSGDGIMISVSRMTCRDPGKVLDLLRIFAEWVMKNEPGVLTYATFSRPKAWRELLLFVRYEDAKAMRSHSIAPEHVQVVKKLAPLLEGNLGTGTTLWKEINDSFVTKGLASNSSPKL